MKKSAAILALLFLPGGSGCAGRRTGAGMTDAPAPAAELRAFWVDGFHAGIRAAQEADQLVADAKRANVNTLIVQVRRRGDALYAKSFEPPVEDPAYDPGFDALDNIIKVAHRAGLEVHAWINAMPVWRNQPPPRDPRHVFNQHGPAQGEDSWMTYSHKGEVLFPVGYFLDPGHPAAAQYLTDVYLNIVKNYAVDGIHFDYIRYPETNERMPRGAPVGYNPTNLARFRQATGRKDMPAPGDEQWMAWRRRQVTQLVRRIYIETKAINPRIKVSAATIAWGKPPLKEKDFLDAAPGQRIYQDWHAWLKEGILDLAVPMNYARESDSTVKGWFDGWIRWEKHHKHGRQLAVGIGAYLNSQQSNLAQIERVRRPEGRNHVDGVSLFSYANLNAAPTAATGASGSSGAPPLIPNPERVMYLAEGAAAAGPAFASPAPVPKMDWIEHPRIGWVAGTVRGADGKGIDGARVRLRRAGWWPLRRDPSAIADGNGCFGFAGIKPGRYEVRLEGAGSSQNVATEVQAGRVARAELRKR